MVDKHPLRYGEFRPPRAGHCPVRFRLSFGALQTRADGPWAGADVGPGLEHERHCERPLCLQTSPGHLAQVLVYACGQCRRA